MQLNDQIRTQLLGGALADRGGCLAGEYRGFSTILSAEKSGCRLCVSASRREDGGNAALSAFLENIRRDSRDIQDLEVLPARFTVTFRRTRKPVETINAVMEPIYTFLSEGGYASGCSECGGGSPALWQVGEQAQFLCADCGKKAKKAARAAAKQVPSSRLLPGLMGALLGALLGAILWPVLFRMGHTGGCGLAGLAMAVLALLGYKLLGKRLDRRAIVGIGLVLAVTIFLVNRCTWAYEGYLGLSGEYGWTYGDVFRDLRTVLEGAEVYRGYCLQCLLGLALAAAVLLPFGLRAFRLAEKNRVKKLK